MIGARRASATSDSETYDCPEQLYPRRRALLAENSTRLEVSSHLEHELRQSQIYKMIELGIPHPLLFQPQSPDTDIPRLK
ncbi:hypothetical protein ACHAWO_008644 [Cyclotella atomus]|uniref:Uncharacterized protein n=1 Tax=Cyclotella atomus TaxID=382360 RepID=A0ABD3MSP5_9STRA